ncbi:MAG: hypothetical protein LN588_00830 [Rickettsia endosymbiont of Bryobia graminum]|nr:hypothetical protein [Rickettsia endosymbiont of Bryobia graminum]
MLHELGAEVISCGIRPDGLNINDKCGVLDYKMLSDLVMEHKADLGIALDGDADRILIIDEKGQLIDGDQIIASLAYYLSGIKGGLTRDTIVTTVMSNMGLELYLKSIGMNMVRTDVGDKYVVRKMQELGCNLGGEESGHIIIRSNQGTGDGIRVALQILAMYKMSKDLPISQLLNKFKPIPQLMHDVHYNHKYYEQNVICPDTVNNVMNSYQERYNNEARILIRKSGTQPIIRLMVESLNKQLAEDILSNIQTEIEQNLKFS